MSSSPPADSSKKTANGRAKWGERLVAHRTNCQRGGQVCFVNQERHVGLSMNASIRLR